MGRWAPRHAPLGLRRREELLRRGVSCVLSQRTAGKGPPWQHETQKWGYQVGSQSLSLQHQSSACRLGSTSSQDEATGSLSPSCSATLGCLTLLLWLWVLCTACNRRCPSLPGLGGACSALQPEWAGTQAGPAWLCTYFLMGLGPEAVISDPCLCLPGLMRSPGTQEAVTGGSCPGCRAVQCQQKW